MYIVYQNNDDMLTYVHVSMFDSDEYAVLFKGSEAACEEYIHRQLGDTKNINLDIDEFKPGPNFDKDDYDLYNLD